MRLLEAIFPPHIWSNDPDKRQWDIGSPVRKGSAVFLLASAGITVLLTVIMALTPETTWAAFQNGQPADALLGQIDWSNTSSVQPSFVTGGYYEGVNGHTNRTAGTVGVIDQTHHRLFVGDYTRVLVYELSDMAPYGLEDKVADYVLGQPDMNATGNWLSSSYNYEDRVVALAYDPTHDRLFVASELSRVLVYDTAEIVSGELPTSVLGQTDIYEVDVPEANTQSSILWPTGLALDVTGNTLFVGQFSRVSVFDVAAITDGEAATAVIGQPDFTAAIETTTQNTLYDVRQIAFDDTTDRLYVADNSSGRVLVFDTSVISNGEDAIAVLGKPTFTAPNNGSVSQTNLYYSYGLTVDRDAQRLYASDSSARILVFDVADISNGEAAVNVLGQPDFTTASYGTGLTQNRLAHPPTWLEYDAVSDRLYAWGDNRATIFDVSTIADGEDAIDVLGQYDSNDPDPFATTPIFTKNGVHDGPNRVGFDFYGDTEPFYGASTPAFDHVNHRLFMSDPGNRRVLMYEMDEDNHLLDSVADAVLGRPDFNSISESLTQNNLYLPKGLAFDAATERLYVSDGARAGVMVFDVAEVVSGEDAIAVIGAPSFEDYGVFTFPQLALSDDGGKLFIADYDSPTTSVYDVAEITLSESPIATFSTEVVYPYDLEVSGDRFFISGSTGQTEVLAYDISDLENVQEIAGSIVIPCGRGLAVAHAESEYLFVGSCVYDDGVYMYNIDEINEFEYPERIIGQPVYGAVTQSSIDITGGMSFDDFSGTLAVQDPGNHRVLLFYLDLEHEAPVAINDLDAVGGFRTAVLFWTEPDDGLSDITAYEVHFSKDGFVTDDQVCDTVSCTDAETGAEIAGLRNGTEYTFRVFAVNAIGTSAASNDAAARPSRLTITADFVLGQPDFTTGDEWGYGEATANSFMSLSAVDYDSENELLFVADREASRILVFDVSGGIENNMEARYVIGQPDFTTVDAGTSQNELNDPTSISYDATNDRLYVADGGNNRVLVFDVSLVNLEVHPFGMDAEYVIGASSFDDGVGELSQSSLDNPRGVELDPIHKLLYVADNQNYRVMIFDISNENLAAYPVGMNATAVIGQPDFLLAGYGVTQNTVSSPQDVQYASGSELLFVGTSSRVLVFDVSEENLAAYPADMNAMAVIGQPDFETTSNNNPAAVNLLGESSPSGLAYDASHDLLYLGDPEHHRTMVFDVSSENIEAYPFGMDAVDVIGQPDFVSDYQFNTSQTSLGYPDCSAFDATEDLLFICDSEATRLLVYGLTPPPRGGSSGRDQAPPVISAIAGFNGDDGLVITWTTDEPANSYARFGPEAAYGMSSADPSFTTSHSLVLRGPTTGLAYHLQICSADSGLNTACSDDLVLTIDEAGQVNLHALQTIPQLPAELSGQTDEVESITSVSPLADSLTDLPPDPQLFDISILEIDGAVVVLWKTDIAADSVLEYGKTVPYDHDMTRVVQSTHHEFVLRGLEPGANYHFRVSSQTAAGVKTMSEDLIFMKASR